MAYDTDQYGFLDLSERGDAMPYTRKQRSFNETEEKSNNQEAFVRLHTCNSCGDTRP